MSPGLEIGVTDGNEKVDLAARSKPDSCQAGSKKMLRYRFAGKVCWWSLVMYMYESSGVKK